MSALYRPVSLPTVTTPRSTSPTSPASPPLVVPLRNRPLSGPARPISLQPQKPNEADGSIPSIHSPLAQPPFLPAPSSPSLNIAQEGLTSGSGEIKPRNIVILLDGTGNQFSRTNSNVIKTLSVLEADETQLLYYSSGVGTILPDHASTWGSVRTAIAGALDKALAWNFQDFVCDAYKYLMDFYRAGDKVYIFGFSRGAYTARALAGMIQKVGLLPPGNVNQVPLAYEVYIRPQRVATREGMSGDEDPSVMYRQIFGISRTVRIEFLGVWDTVSSLGGITLPVLPNAGNVKSVTFFRQALALDERRARFAPEYRRLDKTEDRPNPSTCEEALTCAQTAHDTLHSPSSTSSQKAAARQTIQDMLDQKYPEIGRARFWRDHGEMETRYLRRNVECWFMGCHSDVGGGNDLNGQDSLSNIPFRWLLREAVSCGLKLEAVGVCLQPAIYLHPAVVASGLIPDQLVQILKEELRGETVEFETENQVRSLVDQHLPHGRLVEILNLAAWYDAGVTPHEVNAEESKRREAEGSLSLDRGPREESKQKEAEGGPREIRVDNAQKSELGQQSDSSTGSGEHHPYGDDRKGLPICPDGLKLGTESLKGIWWLLEGAILQTRRYDGDKGTAQDVWRANLGRPRQILAGQYIHRSVQIRLRYELPLGILEEEKKIVKLWKRTSIKAKEKWLALKSDNHTRSVSKTIPPELGSEVKAGDGTGYQGPRAELPAVWGFTWDDLRRGEGGLIWEE